MNQNQLWNEVLPVLATSFGESFYNQWILPMTCVQEQNRFMLICPNDVHEQMIRSNALQKITDIMESKGLDLSLFDVDVCVKETAGTALSDSAAPPTAPAVEPPKNFRDAGMGLLPRYTFDNFVVGETNRYAFSNAMSISSSGKSDEGSVLFIFGESGVGKTHLMHAVGNHYNTLNPTDRVVCVTCERFLTAFFDSITNRTQKAFREQFRSVNLLMIDDVQNLSVSKQLQEELFATFNDLYNTGHKMVFTSDRPPKELDTFVDRLRTRLAWGTIVDLQTPEPATRVAILKKKAEKAGFDLPNDVAIYIAESINSNVRELEGALKRLIGYCPDATVTLERAREILLPVLGELLPARNIDADLITELVCKHFNVALPDVIGASRLKKIAEPRHIAQYLIREMTGLSFPKIAEKFGGRDHTSVQHGCRKVANEVEIDENYKSMVQSLMKTIRECTVRA